MTPSTQKINQEETKNPEKRSNPQPIVLYCLGLNTQNPELREVDYEPSPKRGSGKINRLRPRKKKQQKASCVVQRGCKNKYPALTEVDLVPSAKRGTNRTKTLVSLY